VLLGTNRADGWPRISPCEAFVVDGELMLGMMWKSRKALDLLRDPRLSIATVQTEREPTYGDLKLYGTAVDVPEPRRRLAYADHLEANIAWRPAEPYHLFSADIQRAGYISFGDERRMARWSEQRGVEELPHPDGHND
jgi:hypothetical protein